MKVQASLNHLNVKNMQLETHQYQVSHPIPVWDFFPQIIVKLYCKDYKLQKYYLGIYPTFLLT